MELIILSEKYKYQYLKMIEENAEELKKTGFNFRFPLSTEESFTSDLKILEDRKFGVNVPDWEVPNETLYLYDEKTDEIVGGANIRKDLKGRYLIDGGHIGYYVCKNNRGKGFAREILRLSLEKLLEFGVENVLMVCVKGNVASAKTIISNGGVFEGEVEYNGKVFERYWIRLG